MRVQYMIGALLTAALITGCQASTAADEEAIRDAVQGMVDSVDNQLGVPDDTLGIHMEAMSQVCLVNYQEEYLTGFQP